MIGILKESKDSSKRTVVGSFLLFKRLNYNININYAHCPKVIDQSALFVNRFWYRWHVTVIVKYWAKSNDSYCGRDDYMIKISNKWQYVEIVNMHYILSCKFHIKKIKSIVNFKKNNTEKSNWANPP